MASVTIFSFRLGALCLKRCGNISASLAPNAPARKVNAALARVSSTARWSTLVSISPSRRRARTYRRSKVSPKVAFSIRSRNRLCKKAVCNADFVRRASSSPPSRCSTITQIRARTKSAKQWSVICAAARVTCRSSRLSRTRLANSRTQVGTDMHNQLRNEYDVIGQPTPKKDGALKALGRAEYADDISMPGMLHGKLLRSPHPHARIVRIDISRAEALPGVRAIVTGKDFPGIKYGNLPQTRDYLTLAVDTVRYIGEEGAAVAAIDEDTAEEALDLIEVEYELLPAVFDPEEAMRSGAPLLHDKAPGNLSAQIAFEFGEVDEAFSRADYVREDIFETQPVKQGMLEPHACVGLWDSSGKISLWACKMSPYVVWRQLAMGLGVELGNVRVVQTFVGGGFSGGKQEE